jgi:1-piperideine-2-carboxylate/1-pyrroline-2-carboxylate reductase [NAD(P)H]
MKILDPLQTAQALPYAALVESLAIAIRQLAEGAIRAPERQVVAIDAQSVLLGMPAIAVDIGITKQITVHADNRRHGLPAIQGEVIVFDTATGRRHLLMDGPTTSARRTAGISLLGIRTLLPRQPRSAILIGTGVQTFLGSTHSGSPRATPPRPRHFAASCAACIRKCPRSHCR